MAVSSEIGKAAEEYIQSFRTKTLDGNNAFMNPDMPEYEDEKIFGSREYESKIQLLEKEIFALKLKLFYHTNELRCQNNCDTTYINLQIQIGLLNEELKSKQQIIMQAAGILRNFKADQQRRRELDEKRVKFQQFDTSQPEKYVAMQLRNDAMTRQIAVLQTELSNKQQDIAEKDIIVDRLRRELQKCKWQNRVQQRSRHQRQCH